MTIKTLVLNKEGKLEEKEIHNTLEDLQKIVEGYIEIPYLSKVFAENGIDIIINEEGKLMDLKPSIAVIDKESERVLDVVCGRCIFASHDEDGETIGLTEKQMTIIKEELMTELEFFNGETFDVLRIRALYI